MPNYAQNIANKKNITLEQAQTNFSWLLVGMAYTRLQKPLGNAADDLFWSMTYATLEQKVEMAQTWEEYFCQTKFST